MFGMRHRIILACALALAAVLLGAGTAAADAMVHHPGWDLPDPVGMWVNVVLDLVFDIV